MRSRLSLRSTLTLVFVGVMVLVLASIGSFLYFRTRSNLDSAIQDSLRTRAGTLAELVRRSPSTRRDVIEPGERFAQVLTRDGRVLDSRPQGASRLLTPAEVRGVGGESFFERHEESRLLALPVRIGGRDLVVVAGTSLEDREHALESLGGALLVGAPLALLLASGVGWWLAGAALRPVELMRRRASEITTADSSARLPVPESRDEIHRLATTLNGMLDRLAATAEHERAFVANASHELRTPLATLRAELELALRHATSVEELRSAAGAAIDDADGLARLADDLLVLARADSGRLPLRAAPVDLVELLRSVAAELEHDPRLEGRELRVEDDGPNLVHADSDRLRQALRNMAGNALVHGRGAIVLASRHDGDRARLSVRDDGAALDDATLATAFDRFSRGPAGAERPGSGLGLAIVGEIARLHGGEARLENTERGVSCVLELPVTSVSAQSAVPHSAGDVVPAHAAPTTTTTG